MQKRLITLTGILMTSFMTHSAEPTQEYSQLSRYVKINVDAEYQQKNPLKTIVSIRFPDSIETVGQAATYALEQSGYVMPNSKGLTEATRILVSRPLPRVHREFKHVTLENILKTLAGEAFVLLVDPISRKVNFVTNLELESE
jgi:conjugative transfer region protein (TIGR03748 family)